MDKDFLIVGGGVAGCVLALQLEKNHSVDLVDNHLKENATLVAAGMINPMVFRRMIPCWRAKEFLDVAIPFYRNLEQRLKAYFLHQIKLAKIINDVNEKKLWLEACENEATKDFLNPNFINNQYEDKIDYTGNIGEVKLAYQLDTYSFLTSVHGYFSEKDSLKQQFFNHKDLIINKDDVEWNSRKYKGVIFCEGMGIKDNPYFNYLPFKPTKGELLEIESEVEIEHTIKKNIFIHPEGNNKYWVGATYNWEDLTSKPTKKGREELLSKLDKVAKFDYKVVNQIAGVRPTVRDRRPYLGTHPKHQRLHILNGLGTRGVLMAPLLAEELIKSFSQQDSIHDENKISRISN